MYLVKKKVFIFHLIFISLKFEADKMTETSEKIDKVFAEVEKVITKFTGISEHATKLIQNEIASLDQLRTTLSESKH